MHGALGAVETLDRRLRAGFQPMAIEEMANIDDQLSVIPKRLFTANTPGEQGTCISTSQEDLHCLE